MYVSIKEYVCLNDPKEISQIIFIFLNNKNLNQDMIRLLLSFRMKPWSKFFETATAWFTLQGRKSFHSQSISCHKVTFQKLCISLRKHHLNADNSSKMHHVQQNILKQKTLCWNYLELYTTQALFTASLSTTSPRRRKLLLEGIIKISPLTKVF